MMIIPLHKNLTITSVYDGGGGAGPGGGHLV